jgi:hydroxymethylbilane synthase
VPSGLRLATRPSRLARWQAEHVAGLLSARHPGLSVELVTVSTTGDQRRDVPIGALGGQGVFVKEVEAAVLDGRADAAVHSAKDLPSATAPGLRLVAVPSRADPRDALVGARLDALPPGACVGTGSVRRRAQLAWLRPDLTFREIRGNVPTRVARASELDAVVVALAALLRLDLAGRASEVLGLDVMLPQVGQGALAVECRMDDQVTAGLMRPLEDRRARDAVDAERAFLARLGGGCDLPAGAHATEDGAGALTVDGLVASLDGRVVLRDRIHGRRDDASLLGRRLAERLLFEGGGSSLVDELAGRPPATGLAT